MDVQVSGPVRVEMVLGNPRFIRFIERWGWYSPLLDMWIWIPKGFVCDTESVPLFKCSNPEAGCGHDYLSCYDSVPLVTKQIAASCYRELQRYFDNLEGAERKNTCITEEIEDFLNGIHNKIHRDIKTGVVRIWPRYFHRRSVYATYEEIKDIV